MQTFLIIVGAAMFLTGLAGLARRLRGPLIQDDGKPDEAEGEPANATGAGGTP